MKNYHWTSEGRNAALHDVYKKPQRYNRESLELAIQTVTKNRSEYATEKAWQDHLEKFTEGLRYITP